jgi:hypothetical protein
MEKNQKATSCRPHLTGEQRLNRICSILSNGVMRRILAEKAAGQAGHAVVSAEITLDDPRKDQS